MRVGFLSHCDINLYRFRLSLMQEFVQRGHEVYAIAPREDKLEDFKKHGIKPIPWRISRPSINPLSAIRSIGDLIRILRPLHLDLLHTYMAKPNIFGNIATKIVKVPHVINAVTGLGCLYVEDGFKIKILRAVVEIVGKFTYGFSDLVLFQNQESYDYFVNKKIITSAKGKVIKGSGIDLDYWQQEITKTQRAVKVLMISRLIKHKGVIEYLEATSRLIKRGLNIECALIGAPDQGNPYAVYDRVFKKYPEIEYLGYVENIKLKLQEADIVVYPSYYGEGIPRTLLEAAAMGKAIITTNTPGCRDVVENEKSGLLISPQNVTELILAIERLVTNLELRERFGNAARKRIEKFFDEKQIISEHFTTYKQIGVI